MSDPFSGVVFPESGRSTFNELLQVTRFLKSRNVPPLKTNGDQWFAWNGRAWEETPRERFSGWVMESLPRDHRLARNAKAVMDHVQLAQQLAPGEQMCGAVKFEDEKREAILVNVENGIVRMHKAEGVKLLKHNQAHNFTGYLRAAWLADADAPLFQKLVDEALPDGADQALLQWFSGYLLYPDAQQHEVYLLCFGEGGTGKSTIAEAILKTIGGEPLATALSMSQICGTGPASYSLPKLQHAIVNMGTEVDTVEMEDSANFKRIVSGETIEARTIYGRPFPMTTTAKLWFLSNSLPRFKHGTEAELRRTRFLLFKNKPAVKDLTLKRRLADEVSGVLSYMVQGLAAILQGMPCPEGGEESQRVKAKFAVANDPVTAFVNQCCELDPEFETPKAEIYDEFTGFLDGWGFGEKSKRFLFQDLFQRVPSLIPHRYYEGNKAGKEAGRYIRGIQLKPAPEE